MVVICRVSQRGNPGLARGYSGGFVKYGRGFSGVIVDVIVDGQ